MNEATVNEATKALIKLFIEEKTEELEILLKEGKIMAYTKPEWRGNGVYYTMTPKKNTIKYITVNDFMTTPD